METVREYALKFLTKRERSFSELRQKLLEKFPDKISEIESVLDEFLQKKWVSDTRFAQAFVHDQMLSFHSGPRKILQKLRQKGVEKGVGESVLRDLFSEEEQFSLAFRLAEKKKNDLLRREEIATFDLRSKIFSFLISKGYEMDIVKRVLKDLFTDQE